MIAADTSSIIAYLEADEAIDSIMIDRAAASEKLYLPPVVLLELQSDPGGDAFVFHFVQKLPLLRITDGYWSRAAASRRKILSLGLKAKLGDALIAQSCIDYAASLITRDKDFRHYSKHCGLKLYDA